ncbi:MAG: phenylacetate--CoA ligase family protein [Deltaproteobacteria bacterium]|nr:phenylacetate--CoA ligase family protein [Deltaproteobacteria bacterium]MBW2661161.1 phenylacetate--CoA ligase family protein [Deltaproteobacteria bacterium]
MDIREFITHEVGLPLFEIAKGLKIRDDLQTLKRFSRRSREEIRSLQNYKLSKIVKHAYDTVPFYKKRFDSAGISPHDICGQNDLKGIPELSREDIQKHGCEMISSSIDLMKCYKGSSSGSTGQPVVYYRDRRGLSCEQAARYFGWGLSGWRFGAPFLSIWGNPTTVRQDWSRLSSKAKSILFFERKVPAYRLINEENFYRLYEIHQKMSVKFIQGYTNAIYAYANFINMKDLDRPQTQGVLTTAENLQPHQREIIEYALGPVYDFYGCGEINSVAFQCGFGEHYHIIEPHVILEYGDTVDDMGNRKFLITDLDNYAMPFIRYVNGDMGLPGSENKCPCGSSFSTLGGVSGRTGDVIRTPEGGILSIPSFLGSRLLKELKGLIRYQVEIVERGAIIIRLQVNPHFNREEKEIITKSLREYIPDSIDWSIALADDILPDNNGKFKLVLDKRKDGNYRL